MPSDSAKEVAAGSVSGIAGKLVEYPFDTTKVRLQTQSPTAPRYSGAIDCLRQTLRDEGLVRMYKGISAPMVAAAAENAVLFTSFSFFDGLLNMERGPTRALLAGCLSGLATSFVLTPIELVKCQIQVDTQSRHAWFWRKIAATYRSEGLRGFWRGQTGTALRESGGSAAWFGTYSLLKDQAGPLVAGAAAGVGYNLSLYPADSIKSRMQTDRVMGAPQHSFWRTGVDMYKQSGLRGLYRGSLVTCIRAVPSNAVIFGVHDFVLARL